MSDIIKLGVVPGICIGYENLLVTAAVGGVQMTVPPQANRALITVRSGDATNDDIIRYLEVSPTTLVVTSAVGIPLDNKTVFEIVLFANLINFRAIRTGAVSHNLYIQYYK